MKYGPDITKEMAGYLERGSNRVDACDMAGICYDTFLDWMQKFPEFLEAIKKAEFACKQRNIDIIQKAAKKTWTAGAWWLERKHPDEFSIRNKHEVSGELNLKINVTNYADNNPAA